MGGYLLEQGKPLRRAGDKSRPRDLGYLELRIEFGDSGGYFVRFQDASGARQQMVIATFQELQAFVSAAVLTHDAVER